MNILYIAVLTVCVCYGALSVFGGIAGIYKKTTPMLPGIAMAAGGIATACAVILGGTAGLVMLAAGLVVIQLCAVLNGLRLYGRIHPVHHAVRLLVAMAAIVLYILLLK